MTSDGTKIIHRRGGQVTREFTGPEMLAAVREEAAVLAGQSGHVAIDVIINGSNTVQFGKKVAGGARDLVQRLELHRGADGVSTLETFYHEQVEADWKANLLRGTITLEETQRALGGLAATLHPEQARTPVERALAERVQRIARGEANETETRETLSELASADLLGRVPEGGARHGAGSVSVALDAAARSARDQQTVTAVGKVRAFLGCVQRKFQAVLDTLVLARGAQRPEHPHAAALARARRTGQAADYDALMSKVLGLYQLATQEAVINTRSKSTGTR